MVNVIKKIKNTDKIIWLLVVIVLVGIFFRTYKFEDFLRFNPDQARDAGIVRSVLIEKESLPLLGPQAGGTEFKLGPIFYYFQFVSAKIFGIFPDRMAFPDLLTSILSIPLLYFFLRKYFDKKTSLLSVALFAVSYYTIKYARFAWNPNSMPFYVLVFLYSLNEIVKPQQKRKILWAIILGVSIGIGIQLHSLLLFSLPVVIGCYFAYLFFKKNPAWKYVFVVGTFIFLLNIPQVYSEIKTKGKNTQAFLAGFEDKSSRKGTAIEKIILNITCHIQANSFMVSSLGSRDNCDFIDAKKKIAKNEFIPNIILIGNIIFSIIFSLGGYTMLVCTWKKEKDFEKKNFFGIIIFYISFLFIMLIPLAKEISFRFFLVVEFLPFIFLAFWLKFIIDKLKQRGFYLALTFIILLASFNIYNLFYTFSYLAGNAKERSEDFEGVSLGEVRGASDFIIKNNDNKTEVYIKGKPGELFRVMRPIEYFTKEKNIKITDLKKGDISGKENKFFLIDIVGDPQSVKKNYKNISKDYNIIDSEKINRIMIYSLQEK